METSELPRHCWLGKRVGLAERENVKTGSALELGYFEIMSH